MTDHVHVATPKNLEISAPDQRELADKEKLYADLHSLVKYASEKGRITVLIDFTASVS